MCEDESGSGAIGTIGGALMFLTFLFIAVQVVLYMFATSVVTSAAFEAARLASADGPAGMSPQSIAGAEDQARLLIGGFDPDPVIDVYPVGLRAVHARVEVDSPLVFAPLIEAVPGLGSIIRTVEYEREAPVPVP